MAKNDETEEKSLPPSRVKLDRLRREGQVPRSKEIPVAISVLAVAAYVTWGMGDILKDLSRSFDFSLQAASRLDVAEAASEALKQAGMALLDLIWLPLLLGLVVTIAASIIDAQGFPVSMKNMQFDFTRLNPVDGIKKLFSLPSLAEFGKGIVKFLILGAAGGGAILYFLNGIFWAPLCGETCSLSTAVHLLGTILVIASAVMLLAAFFDIRISRALFKHEHRMTKTEARREYKDTQGDPHVKSARRQIGAEMRNGPPRKQGPGGK
ncbi:type III secretion system protein [Rhizobium sp. M10]|uniref:EscU/YscU/HrcU family type III secretion system export apparatus switch protein n=1 Tax=Rhizobium sp. M10 TaxID=1324586 RepID=UPI000BE8A286|nr:EscU/YscU/HrcU family type III secretion system export apparatus switch protein [Rhizobium sp. M10]PDT34760.1 type III secretion system protein [Rhizobium sp. M10]